MKKKLLMLTAALSLSVAASVSAIPSPLYIICDTCTTTNPAYQCKCTSNSVRPGYISNCSRWITDCWNGFPP